MTCSEAKDVMGAFSFQEDKLRALCYIKRFYHCHLRALSISVIQRLGLYIAGSIRPRSVIVTQLLPDVETTRAMNFSLLGWDTCSAARDYAQVGYHLQPNRRAHVNHVIAQHPSRVLPV